MVRAVDVLDALQGRAYELYKPESTLHAMNDPAPSKAEAEWEKQAVRATVGLLERVRNPDVFHESSPLMSTTSSVGDEDLIDMSLRGYVSEGSYRQELILFKSFNI